MDWLAPTLHEIIAVFSPVTVLAMLGCGVFIWLYRMERNANMALQNANTEAMLKIADTINSLKMFLVTKGKIS